MVRLWPHPGPFLPSGLPRFGSPRGRGLGGPTLWQCSQRRGLVTLGIETSCDDTCVAVISTAADGSLTGISGHNKVTCANKHHRGIHPVEAVESHTRNLAKVARKALKNSKPDLIAVTRGPGMKACLSVGISFAKALSLAWGVPLVGVHHMQAHALSIELDAQELVLANKGRDGHPPEPPPEYPFLTLLVSGGHTMLVHTKSAIEHRVLASTQRGITNPTEKGKGSATAVGEMLDKCARDVLPPEFLETCGASGTVAYAKAMESFCRLETPSYQEEMLDKGYKAPQEPRDGAQVYHSKNNSWYLPPPLRHTKDMTYDFTGLGGKVRAIIQQNPDMEHMERMELAYHTMRLAFEHLMSRVILALENDQELLANPPKELVIAGGVASNIFLRVVAASVLEARGFGHMAVRAPRMKFCTDNAAMIAWAGQKMYAAGWTTDWSFLPQDEWPIEEILTGVDCWVRRDHVKASGPEAKVSDSQQDQTGLLSPSVPGTKAAAGSARGKRTKSIPALVAAEERMLRPSRTKSIAAVVAAEERMLRPSPQGSARKFAIRKVPSTGLRERPAPRKKPPGKAVLRSQVVPARGRVPRTGQALGESVKIGEARHQHEQTEDQETPHRRTEHDEPERDTVRLLQPRPKGPLGTGLANLKRWMGM